MLIIGIKRIALYCQKNDKTIYRWIHEYGFPAAQAPGGEWITDPELIRRWILARHEASLKGAYKMRQILNDSRYRELYQRIQEDIRRENKALGVPDDLGIAPGA